MVRRAGLGWLAGGGWWAVGGRAVGVGEVSTLLKARVTGGEERKGKGMIKRFERGGVDNEEGMRGRDGRRMEGKRERERGKVDRGKGK